MIEKITNKSFNTFKEYVYTMDVDCCYCVDHWKSLSLKEVEECNTYLFIADNGVVGFGCVVEHEGKTALEVIFLDYDYQEKIAIEAAAKWKDSLFLGFSWDASLAAGLVLCNDKSTQNENETYSFSSEAIFTNGDANFVRDAFEKKYVVLMDESLDDLHIVEMSSQEMYNYIYNHDGGLIDCPSANVNGGTYRYPGFAYLNNQFVYYNNGSKYLAAFLNNKIVGVIHYDDTPAHGFDITHILFVDVAYGARNKGVATMLVKELNNHIDKSKKFRIGALSVVGKICGIDKVFKRYITGVTF